jgi:hypothetical protein
VVLRDRDNNGGGHWTGASDGTLEDRVLYCQNWRADISAVITAGGAMVEWVKYLSYGTPFGLPGGDTDSDGDADETDFNTLGSWPGGYDVRGDVDLDGDVDEHDFEFSYAGSGNVMAHNVMTSESVQSRKGYAGYENSFEIVRFNHVRHRVMDTGLGRWLSRPPSSSDGSLHVVIADAIRSMSPYNVSEPLVRRCCDEDDADQTCQPCDPCRLQCGSIPGVSREDCGGMVFGVCQQCCIRNFSSLQAQANALLVCNLCRCRGDAYCIASKLRTYQSTISIYFDLYRACKSMCPQQDPVLPIGPGNGGDVFNSVSFALSTCSGEKSCSGQ